MDQDSSPPLVTTNEGWTLKIKNYPHFDAPISAAKIRKLVSDPSLVKLNTFYPFVRYTQVWQPYRSRRVVTNSGVRIIKPDKKERPIRFASRRDAYIFSYYRHLLSAPYEALLLERGLSENVLAYRRIKAPDGTGKSNVEFSRGAVLQIQKLQNCAAVAVDISSFFESLDHGILRARWAEVLGCDDLPPDHEAVYKAVTRYAVVDREALYERLGYLKKAVVRGVERWVYTCSLDEMPKKLCSNVDFRVKVCGRGGQYKSLIEINKKPYGIPQGSPISDMLANLYLLDFDVVLKSYCEERGGVYYRYSDDVLMLVPGGAAEAAAAVSFVTEEIRNHGSKLVIKSKKTSAVVYRAVGDRQEFELVDGQMGRNGLEYLGFRYDGQKVRIRDATISKLYRKVSGSIKAEVRNLLSRYRTRDAGRLFELFDFSAFFQRYGRVEDFDPSSDYDHWTFWTYSRKATNVFGRLATPIPSQLRNYRSIVRRRVAKEIERRVS